MKPNKIKLIADATKMSNIRTDALNTFRDQQKFKVKLFLFKSIAKTTIHARKKICLLSCID